VDETSLLAATMDHRSTAGDERLFARTGQQQQLVSHLADAAPLLGNGATRAHGPGEPNGTRRDVARHTFGSIGELDFSDALPPAAVAPNGDAATPEPAANDPPEL